MQTPKTALFQRFCGMRVGERDLFQFFFWTYGVWTTKPKANRQTYMDEHPARTLGSRILGMLSPALVAVILAIAIVLIGIPVPQAVIAPLAFAGRDLHSAVDDLSRRSVRAARLGRRAETV